MTDYSLNGNGRTDWTPQQFIGTLYTQPLDADAVGHSTLEGIGQFTVKVEVAQGIFDASTDKFGLVKHTIALYLASAIMDTDAPAHFWFFTPSPLMQTAFNLPPVMSLKG